MSGRTRTTKKLAQRINLNYFKRAYPMPRWKRWLSIGLTVLGLGWLLLAGKDKAFNAGPLARGHAILGNKCEACHAEKTAFGTKVSEQACLGCHDAPRHHAEQTFTPSCASCHVEHQGSFKLAAMSDSSCTQCHSDLKLSRGNANVATSIESFQGAHPEFGTLKTRDPGTIKFGHRVHMKKDLKGPQGPVQLDCSDCHRLVGGSMTTSNFERDCQRCHNLRFDERVAEQAPHKDTAAVQRFLTDTYRGAPVQRLKDAERLLWQKTCKECHPITYPIPGERPEVLKAGITAHWMKHARFDHKPHQLVACTQCHAQATSSNNTADVMLPGIAACRQCHNGGSNSADARCSECHLYHDRSLAKPVKPRLTLSQF